VALRLRLLPDLPFSCGDDRSASLRNQFREVLRAIACFQSFPAADDWLGVGAYRPFKNGLDEILNLDACIHQKQSISYPYVSNC